MNEYDTECARIAALDIDEDEFMNEPVSFDCFPAFTAELDEWLAARGYLRTHEEVRVCSQILAGHFELHRHNASVETHTDDVLAPVHFILAVIRSDAPAYRSDSRFDNRNEFSYYHGRKKESKRLEPGDFVIFNPRRPHGLIFYGRRDTLLLASVKPIKGWVPA